MGKLKYNVKGVEAGQDFDTPVPIGLYRARIDEIEETESKAGNDMLAITLEISRGEFKNRKLWDYIVLNDASAWKLRQFLEAVGEVDDGNESGSVELNSLVGKTIQVRVKHETDDRDPDNPVVRARPGALLALPGEVEEDEEEEDEEAEAAEEGEEADEDDDDEGDDDDDTYDSWTIKELIAECRERGLQIKTSKTGAAKKRYLVNKLEKDDEADGDGSEPF